MLVGDPSVFAIESTAIEWYERLSFRALGSFVVHIDGVAYGRPESDATLLACAFDEVSRRHRARGTHDAAFATDSSGIAIAAAFEASLSRPEIDAEPVLGQSTEAFGAFLATRGIRWAPGGDEEWDDRSRILQFDVGDQVRIVAFKGTEPTRFDHPSFRDAWMEAERFYDVLRDWSSTFQREWERARKIPEGIDQDWDQLAAWRLKHGN